MTRFLKHGRTAALLALSLLAPPIRAAEEARFRPQDCFPADSLLYLEVKSVEGLGEALRSTLYGRIASHPGVRAALGTLPQLARAEIERATAGFTQAAGTDVLSTLGLLRGEIALAAAGMDGGGPRIALAVELGAKREEILGLLAKLDSFLESARGGEKLATMKLGAHTATLWTPPKGPVIGRTVLGTHLVFGFPPDSLAPIAASYEKISGGAGSGGGEPKGQKAEAGAGPLREAPFFASLRPRLSPEPAFLLALDLERIRAVARAFLGADPQGPLEKLLKATGLDAAGALGGSAGREEGELAFRIHLTTPGGPRGILQAISGTLAALPGLAEELGNVPAQATSVFALRGQPGKLIEETLSAVKLAVPESAQVIDWFVGQFESHHNVSLAEDLAVLPPLLLVCFSMEPPAGSIFEDSIALVRTAEFAPYRKFLEIAGGAEAGAGLPAIEEAGLKVRYSSLGSYVDLDGGWTAVSGSVPALRRHLTHYRSMRKVSEEPALMKEWLAKLEGARLGMVLRSGGASLNAYNSLVSLLNLAAPSLEAYLTPLGVDPALLPAGEEFLGELKDGYLRFEQGPEGLSLRGKRVIENSGWLPAIAVGSVAAGFLVPTLMKARGQADAVKCQMNLREIQKLGMIYADQAGTRSFPRSPQGSLGALKLLVDSNPGLKPELFICPQSGAERAEVEDGKFKLDEAHTSYEMVPWKITMEDRPDTIVAFDRTPCHNGRRNVVFIDSSVESMDEAAFQERLSKDRQRFAGAGKPPPDQPEPKKPKQKQKQKEKARKNGQETQE